MTYGLFNLFSDMIDHTPAEAVVPVVEAERRMVADDLATQRVSADEEIESVLTFCNFLAATAKGSALRGTQVLCSVLPIDHFAFYRNTIDRLVGEGILPFEAKQRFDEIFAAPLLPELAD